MAKTSKKKPSRFTLDTPVKVIIGIFSVLILSVLGFATHLVVEDNQRVDRELTALKENKRIVLEVERQIKEKGLTNYKYNEYCVQTAKFAQEYNCYSSLNRDSIVDPEYLAEESNQLDTILSGIKSLKQVSELKPINTASQSGFTANYKVKNTLCSFMVYETSGAFECKLPTTNAYYKEN